MRWRYVGLSQGSYWWWTAPLSNDGQHVGADSEGIAVRITHSYAEQAESRQSHSTVSGLLSQQLMQGLNVSLLKSPDVTRGVAGAGSYRLWPAKPSLTRKSGIAALHTRQMKPLPRKAWMVPSFSTSLPKIP